MIPKPFRVFPPGDSIAGILKEQGLSEKWLAEKLGLCLDDINLLILGKLRIDWDLAFKLEEVLGGTAYFWIYREFLYRYC